MSEVELLPKFETLRGVMLDTWNVELYFQKKGDWPLLTSTQIQSLSNDGIFLEDINEMPNGCAVVLPQGDLVDGDALSLQHNTDDDVDVQFNNMIQRVYPAFHHVMLKFSDELFWAGGSFPSLFQNYQKFSTVNYLPSYVVKDVDLFICAESVERAEEITRTLCDALLKEGEQVKCSALTTNVRYMHTDFQIVRRLYPKGRPDLIPSHFDNWACQFIWNPKLGLRSTLNGAIADKFKAFPEDCDKFSPSGNGRRVKYVNGKSFSLLLPGLTDPESIKRFVERNQYFKREDRDASDFILRLEKLSKTENASAYEDSENKAESLFNMQRYKNGKLDRMTVLVERYEDFCNPEIDVSTIDVCGIYDLFSKERTRAVTPKSVKKYFVNDDDFKRWVNLYFVEEDSDAAYELWIQNLNTIKMNCTSFFARQKRTDLWKVDQPGAQFFGITNPNPIAPVDFYGAENYTRTLVGVDHETYFVMKHALNRYGINRDVLNIICMMLLKHKVDAFLSRIGLRELIA